MASKIQLRRDSSGNWSATNPVLAEGEMGVELDTNRSKLGDGVSNWRDIDYMTDTNAVGTYDANYLIKNRNVGDQIVVSTGTTTFNGRGEFGSGVKVTGGFAGDIVNGIGSADRDELNIYAEGQPKITCRANQTTVRAEGSNTAIYVLANSSATNTGGTATFGIRNIPRLDGQPTTNTYTHYSADSASATGGINEGFVGTGPQVGFNAPARLPDNTSGRTIGFSSSINTDDHFNVFCGGTSPNWFRGDTYIGGTTEERTLGLWKSTLTEQQLEEFQAGRLVAPSNVTTPGDGSYARQWWYNQQSAEDQALIDAGELEYPKPLQAANFVDMFALGSLTNINLLNGGLGVFKGGVKVTGGGAGAVIDGMAKQGNNLTLAVDSSFLLKICNQFGVVSNQTK